MNSPDIELGIPQEGYPALADWIAADPDDETLIFRKFDRLSARNLLFLQAQLYALEAELDELEKELSSSRDVSQRESVRRWETLVKNAQDADRPEFRLMNLAGEIREKLREYHETLILQSRVADLGRPSRRVMKHFRDWFSGTTRCVNKSIIAGRARRMLDDEDELVALRVATEPDMLSTLVQNYWLPEGKPGMRIKGDTRYFRLQHVTRTVAIISTVIAAIQLVGSIVSLYFVTNQAARLGMTASFTVLFGLSLWLLTNARRAEIYGSSAAYAAVLVVFISSNVNQPG